MPRSVSFVFAVYLPVVPGCAICRNCDPVFAAGCVAAADEPEICVAAMPKTDRFHVPGLLLWNVQKSPIEVSVASKDAECVYDSVVLQSVRLEYADGKSVELDSHKTAVFMETLSPEVQVAEITVSDAIKRPKDGRVVVMGELRSVNGSIRPFHARRDFTIGSESQFLPCFFICLLGG